MPVNRRACCLLVGEVRKRPRSRKSSTDENSSQRVLSAEIACCQTSLLVVIPEVAKVLEISSTILESHFIISTFSTCTIAAMDGPQVHFRDASEPALPATEPESALTLRFPWLMLIRTEELDPVPQSDGCRNEEGVESGAEVVSLSLLDENVGLDGSTARVQIAEGRGIAKA